MERTPASGRVPAVGRVPATGRLKIRDMRYAVICDGATKYVHFPAGPDLKLNVGSCSFWVRSFDAIADGAVFSLATDIDNRVQVSISHESFLEPVVTTFYARRNGHIIVENDINGNVSDGFWHFFAFGWDTVGAVCCVDELIASLPTGNKDMAFAADPEMALGAYITGLVPAHCHVTGFRTYSTKLTPAQIADIRVNERIPASRHAYYAFEEGAGSTLHLTEGVGPDGDLLDGAGWTDKTPFKFRKPA